MQSLSQLELSAENQPNSIEVQQTLAETYIKEERWEEAAKTYRSLTSLYPDTAALFINRIRLGAAALLISSGFIFAAALIQPSLSLANLAQAFNSPAYLSAQVLLILALALYSCSAISIYKLLSYTRDHRPAFWAMVVSVIGVGLSMPALGIKSFVYPIIGRMTLAGHADVMDIYLSLNAYPSRGFLGTGGYLLVAGIAIFAGVIRRNKGISLPSILIFFTGWLGMTTTQDFFVFGILAALGGGWLGVSLWNQASVQFNPNMDRTIRS